MGAGMSPEALVLTGIGVNYLFSAATSVIQYFADEHRLAAAVAWAFGSLNGSGWPQAGAAFLAVAPCFLGLWLMAPCLNVLSVADDETARSLGVYDDSAKFLREFCAGEEDLGKFIISTIGSSEPLESPADQGARADTLWFFGLTKADQKALRQQVLATTRQDILDWCPVLEKSAQEGAVCVVGHEEALKACGELEVVSL